MDSPKVTWKQIKGEPYWIYTDGYTICKVLVHGVATYELWDVKFIVRAASAKECKQLHLGIVENKLAISMDKA